MELLRESYHFIAVVLLLLIGEVAKRHVECAIFSPKIFGGSAIDIKEAPYQASIRLKVGDDFMFGQGHVCGGSVVSQRLIITAARCFFNKNPFQLNPPSYYTIVVGNKNLFHSDSNTLVYGIQKLVIHEALDVETSVNDIAAAFIDGYIPWNWPTVSAIALNTKPIAVGTMCAVTGWGKTRNTELSQTLQRLMVSMSDQASCQDNEGKFCINLEINGIGFCSYDSGGPLECGKSLVGIVSYTRSCGLPSAPDVYSNASYYNEWIIKTNSSFDYSYYSGNGISSFHKTNTLLFAIIFVFLAFQ